MNATDVRVEHWRFEQATAAHLALLGSIISYYILHTACSVLHTTVVLDVTHATILTPITILACDPVTIRAESVLDIHGVRRGEVGDSRLRHRQSNQRA